jgi:mRNA-degrading endonuclease RelE of RelBE toxin-antitoxin system
VVSDYKLIWNPEAVRELRALSTRAATSILSIVMRLRSDPFPPYGTVISEEDGLYALRLGTTTVHYDVVGDTVRILMIVRTGTIG